MCRQCVDTPLVDRGRTCLEQGAYLLNWKGCAECGDTSIPVNVDVKYLVDDVVVQEINDEWENETEHEEVTQFMHKCTKCGHEICEHYYRFAVEENMQGDGDNKITCQEFLMECVLCGKGCDTVNLPAFSSRQIDSIAGNGMNPNNIELNGVNDLHLVDNLETPQQVLGGISAQLGRVSLNSASVDHLDDGDEVADDEWD